MDAYLQSLINQYMGQQQPQVKNSLEGDFLKKQDAIKNTPEGKELMNKLHNFRMEGIDKLLYQNPENVRFYQQHMQSTLDIYNKMNATGATDASVIEENKRLKEELARMKGSSNGYNV